MASFVMRLGESVLYFVNMGGVYFIGKYGDVCDDVVNNIDGG